LFSKRRELHQDEKHFQRLVRYRLIEENRPVWCPSKNGDAESDW
jgi:hypothetical protein